MSHPGIELRISVPAGVLMLANSDHLNIQARLGGAGEDGWNKLLPVVGVEGVGELLIETRAVELPDPTEDEHEDQAAVADVDQAEEVFRSPPITWLCRRCGHKFYQLSASHWRDPTGPRVMTFAQLEEDYGDCIRFLVHD